MTDARTALYRLFDGQDRLLYIGIASNPERRWAEHKNDKTWWPQVKRRTVEWHPSRLVAMTAEARAIKSEQPAHNIVIPDPADPMTWPPPDWSARQAEGRRRARAARDRAVKCPDCGCPLPQAKTCPGCGEVFYRGEGGRSDAECCSKRCGYRVRKRRERARLAQQEGGK